MYFASPLDALSEVRILELRAHVVRVVGSSTNNGYLDLYVFTYMCINSCRFKICWHD